MKNKNENSKLLKSGFTNLSNTCYMNSVLQCLINTPGFFDYFIVSQPLKNIAFDFQKICKYFCKEESLQEPFKTNDFIDAFCKRDPSFSKSGSNDAHEFLTSFLSVLHEDLNEIKETIPFQHFEVPLNISIPNLVSKWREYQSTYDRSMVFNFFEVNITNSIECKNCSSSTRTCSNFCNLSLPLPQEYPNQNEKIYTSLNNSRPIDISSIITNFFYKQEKLDSYFCESCSNIRQANLSTMLSQLPQFLVLHLQRFGQSKDSYGNPIQTKINAMVSFPIKNLEMKHFLAPEMRRDEEKYQYDLYGIVEHSGSIHGGHYTASCKHPIDETWNRFDDQSCIPLDQKTLDTYEQNGSSSPYILFYKRRSQS